MTVIDPKAVKAVGTIPLGGGPEFLAADGKGTVWTNLFDKGAFVTIDVKSLKVTKTTPIGGCKGASSMAFDPANRRLFIGCHSHVLVVLDPDSGKVVQTLPIGEQADGMVYDAANRLIFASTSDGFVTIRATRLGRCVHASRKRKDDAWRQDAGLRFEDREALLHNR